MNAVKITENRNSKAQRYWIFIVRFVGFLMFIIPLIQPMYAYMIIGMEEIQFTNTRAILVLTGFIMCSNGKFIGIVNNNLGFLIKRAIKKLIS